MSSSAYPSLPSATSIRLLHLAPGTLDEPIVGSLNVVDLKYKPKYECVSYTWGDAGDEEEISVDGEELFIRRHLWEALRRMRLPDQFRVLWIDALCISQSDLDEKAQQVHMIGKIVSLASSVLAWLGEHADGSEAIFHGWPAEETVTANMPLESIPPDFWKRRIEVWVAFCSRRWFSRTWIIQEVVVAKEVHVFCGKDIGHWTTLFEDSINRRVTKTALAAIGVLVHDVQKVDSIEVAVAVGAVLPQDLFKCYMANFLSLANLVDTRRLWRGKAGIPHLAGSRGLPFERFSGDVIASKCLDRRDKIYALRSIFYGPGARPSHGIPVDYTIDIVELMMRSLDSRIFSGMSLTLYLARSGMAPYLARDLIHLLELSNDEVEAVVDIIASQPLYLNDDRLTVLAYVCITDARTPKEVTSKLLGLSDDSNMWLYQKFWKPGCTEKLLRWHGVRKAGGDMYSLLEDASTSDPQRHMLDSAVRAAQRSICMGSRLSESQLRRLSNH